MAEGLTAANTVSCWFFFFKKKAVLEKDLRG